jgi:AraC family transcriptional regulator of adaptative response/methylated-DNA-[protein]-cysteine methyltransferase
MSSPLGEVLVAATTIGLVAVRIGTGDELERELRTEFAQATLVRDDDVVTPQALAVLERIVHHRETTDLPLDIAATAFQAKVWNALRAIPIGSTRSYGEVAAQIGAPKSARAVASACAHNPVAVVIPCHRVVHADGTMSGYRWGVSVKAQLLDEERR